MRKTCRTAVKVGFALLVPFLTATLNAQIANQVTANIPHDFLILNKALPAGKYVFQMNQDSDLALMTVSSIEGKGLDQFMVRQSVASKTPAHTELVFNRYGDKEFLRKIYERGSRNGVAVSEMSKEEKALMEQGQKPVEHAESNP